MIPSEPDVLVVGAGAAGIAAARAVRAAGLHARVLEAGGRVGGRAWTESASLGAPFDHGATWLHQARDNPLTPHAGPAMDHDSVRERHLWLGDRWAGADEQREHDAASGRFDEAVSAAHPGPDGTVAAAAPRGGRWDATIAHWLGNQINAAPLSAISREDFLRTDLSGPNLLPEHGAGHILLSLAAGLDVVLHAGVERIRWDGPGVAAEGGFGTVRARAAIVTLSTGVLAAGGIRFTPALPPEHEDAIAGLPQGLLLKLGFPALPFGMAPFHSARRAVSAAAPHPWGWVFHPFGRDHLFGFCGGDAAWALAREGRAAVEAHARADLRAMFGGVELGPAAWTDWAGDALFRGSYSHARPGHHASRCALARPLAGGRLLLAGEAAHERFAGTLAGAWLSGERAARLALHSIRS